MTDERPSGFVARCRCGKVTGAMDYDRTPHSDAGKMLGGWLARGCTVEPRFGGQWSENIETCACENRRAP